MLLGFALPAVVEPNVGPEVLPVFVPLTIVVEVAGRLVLVPVFVPPTDAVETDAPVAVAVAVPVFVLPANEVATDALFMGLELELFASVVDI